MKNQSIIPHKTLSTAIIFVTSLGATSQVFAKEEWSHLYGNTGRCDVCHISAVGTKNNTKSSANSAYQSGGLSPGLKKYVTTFLANDTPAIPNTKPVLNSINPQWDVMAGEAITMPLIVNDAEDDVFIIINKAKLPAGAVIADAGVDTQSQLPKWEFTWTPSAGQQNKVYTVKFAGKETGTTKKYSSNIISSKIRVWPAGDQDNAKVSNFMLSNASWKADVLTLKGKVVLNKLLTAGEKADFLNRTDLTVDIYQGKNTNGIAITKQLPINFTKANGSWTLTQPLSAPFACDVSLYFEGRSASRKIAKAPNGCIQ